MCSDAYLTSWTNVRNFFNPELTGPLPNVVIEGTNVEGSENDQVLALPTASEVSAAGRNAHPLLKARLSPEIRLNFWPREACSIDFDIDLKEFQGQERLDLLCAIFRPLGQQLGR